MFVHGDHWQGSYDLWVVKGVKSFHDKILKGGWDVASWDFFVVKEFFISVVKGFETVGWEGEGVLRVDETGEEEFVDNLWAKFNSFAEEV